MSACATAVLLLHAQSCLLDFTVTSAADERAK